MSIFKENPLFGGGGGDGLSAPAVKKIFTDENSANSIIYLRDFSEAADNSWAEAYDRAVAAFPNIPIRLTNDFYGFHRTIYGPAQSYFIGMGDGLRDDIGGRSTIGPTVGANQFVELAGRLKDDGASLTTKGELTQHGILQVLNIAKELVEDPNATDVPTRVFANSSSSEIHNLFIDGENAGNYGIKGFYVAGSFSLHKITRSFCAELITSLPEYQDYITINEMNVDTDALGNQPIINLGNGNGDSRLFKRIKGAKRPGGSFRNTETIKTKDNRSVESTLNIEGNCDYINSYGGSVFNYGESNAITFDGGGMVSFCDYLQNNADTTRSPVTITNSSNSDKVRSSTGIEHLKIGNDISLYGGYSATLQPDINIEPGCFVSIRGSARALGRSGALGDTQVLSTVVAYNGAVVSDWSNYGHLMWSGAEFVNGKLQINAVIPDVSGVSHSIGSIVTVTPNSGDADQITWQGDTGTYAFYSRFYTDPVRGLGQFTTPATNEVTVALTNGGPIPKVLFNQSSGTTASLGKCIIELSMRNTATTTAGQYTHVVRLPAYLCSAALINSTGVNGFPWIISAAAAPTTMNNNGWSGGGSIVNGIAHVYGVASRPSAGTWKIGDFAERTTYQVAAAGANRLLGYKRLTDGSSHVNGTDWESVYITSDPYPANFYTGHAEYSDTQYTKGSPFVPTVDTRVSLPNNAGTVYDSQKPIYITSYYDSATQKILGRNNDGVNIKVRMYVKPTSGGGGAATKIRLFIDIGGAVGIVDAARQELDKGAGVEDFISFSFPAYNLGTWVANGGDVQIEVDGDVDIYGIAFFFSQGHKAR